MRLLYSLILFPLVTFAQLSIDSPFYTAAFMRTNIISGGGVSSSPTNADVLQHVSTSSALGGAMLNNGVLKVAFPEFTQASNTVIVGMIGGSTSLQLGIGFLEAGGVKFTPVSTNADSGNVESAIIYYATNIPVNCRTLLITNKTGANLQFFQVAASEVINIVNAGAIDKVGGTNRNSAVVLSTGMTPTVTNDFFWQISGRDSSPLNTTAFIPTNQTGMSWKFLSTDLNDGMVVQCGIYNSTAAISPTLVMGTAGGHVSACAAFRTTNNQGTWRPTGRGYIAGLQHLSQPAVGNSFSAPVSSLTNVIQVPIVGNLLIQAVNSAGDMFITNSTAQSGVSFTFTTVNRNTTNHENSQFVYALNATPAQTTNLFTVTNYFKNVTNGAVGADCSIIFYDVVQAGAFTFDTRTTNGGDQTVGTGTLLSPPDLTPSVAGGLFLAMEQHEFNTATQIVAVAVFDANFYDAMNVDGPQNMDQNGGWAHYWPSNTVPISSIWQMRNTSALRTWVSDAAYWKP